jgi:hypothetical protein
MSGRRLHLPRPADLPGIAAVAAGRLFLRRGAAAGRGYVSDEAPLIIAGMHRSGTSIVARLLTRCGVYLGGTWVDENHESIFFTRANRAMLGEGPYLLYDYGWTAPKSDAFIQARRGHAERAARRPEAFFSGRGSETVWGWKDPRNSLTLPVWLSIYPNAKVLHVLRDGRAAALSLADRDDLDPSFALALWGHYAERAERALAGLPQSRRATVRFEDLTASPAAVVEELCRFAGVPVPGDLDAVASLVKRERGTEWLIDGRVSALSEHPLLARFGYR